MSRNMNIGVIRGCTLVSGEFFSVNEVIPANITYAQLLEGISIGTYTVKSLADKTYKGQIRDRANTALRAEMVFEVVEDRMRFKVPASTTKDWPNDVTTMFYDVFETDVITDEVVCKAQGQINILAAITNGGT